MKKIWLLLFLYANNLGAQDLSAFFTKADSFFKSHVVTGRVDYPKIVENPKGLEELLSLASKINLSLESPEAYKAFWINCYNLSVIKGVVDHFPINSPLEVSGFFNRIEYSFGAEKYTLDKIEHQLLRERFKDPRLHFVLVCGAVGCPPLINSAYFPNTLDAQLDTQTKKALNGPFVVVNQKKKRLKVSELMEWYWGDFTTGDQKSFLMYLNRVRLEPIPLDYKLSFFKYDWELNIAL